LQTGCCRGAGRKLRAAAHPDGVLKRNQPVLPERQACPRFWEPGLVPGLRACSQPSVPEPVPQVRRGPPVPEQRASLQREPELLRQASLRGLPVPEQPDAEQRFPALPPAWMLRRGMPRAAS